VSNDAQARREVRLVPMSEQQFEGFRERSAREYARDKVQAGQWPEQSALQRARQTLSSLLAQGRHTPDHLLCVAEDAASGARIGTAWLCMSIGRSSRHSVVSTTSASTRPCGTRLRARAARCHRRRGAAGRLGVAALACFLAQRMRATAVRERRLSNDQRQHAQGLPLGIGSSVSRRALAAPGHR